MQQTNGWSGSSRNDGGNKLLEGIRIVDCSTVFAGPAAAAYLSDFGAQVLKVEHPDGDQARLFEPVHKDISLWSKLVNRNKDNVTLDLHHSEGQEIFRKLVTEADVVVENFRPGTLKRWNVDYPSLLKVNPKLIMLHVTAFGQTGPYSSRPGYGTLAEAMSGMAHLIGYPDRPPLLPPLALGDNIGAIAGAFAVVTALFHRERTGQGQEIDLALVEPLLAVLGIQSLVRSVTGESMQRQGNRVNHLAPRGAWQTQDGRWISVTVGNDSTFRSLATAMAMPELLADARFLTNRDRLANVEAIEDVLARWFARTRYEDAIERLEEHKVAHAPLYDAEQLLEDRQLLSREAFVRVDDDELGEAMLPNVLARFSAAKGQVRFAGRPKGSDNERIYRDVLGMSESDLKQLGESGVI
ncbi:CaiB/BaiF CoA-transferase family protein [Variovorax sp. Sphag1AA]|uniref:CaiB/BaiF CoA transferase family protein n=1 Tax=Variovorax sp. Sphag1AA TaxID=2587027 RepID=UPI001617D3CB|nr:CoA transferase [Variovorax sp. Sphag1AA]MBB3181999.1 formyl-CoA transferase [Variovorax sp. Sphag1AA]